MASDQAWNRLFVTVRDFALQSSDLSNAIQYHTKPDERYMLTLASDRVYGTPDEWQIIQAAAGLDSPEYGMREQLLILPNVATLRAMRRAAGFDGYEVI